MKDKGAAASLFQMDIYLACCGSGDGQIAVDSLSDTSALIPEVNPVAYATPIDTDLPLAELL